MWIETDCPGLLALLDPASFAQLHLLKHAGLLGGRARYAADTAGGGFAVSFAPELTTHDRESYPDAAAIHLLSAMPAACLEAYLARLGPGRHILKIPAVLSQAGGHVLTPQRSFVSLSCRQLQPALTLSANRRAIEETTRFPEADAGLFALVHHPLASLNQLLAGQGRGFGIREGDMLIAGCVVYQNHGAIWEIGALATDPAWRRQGLAVALVRHATAWLLTRGLRPRYHVDVSNQASLALARSCGYAEMTPLHHYSLTI